jgi:hypothetical protein
MAPKLSKSEVNYREADNRGEHCGNCSMYKALYKFDGECSLVKGEIYKYDVCDRWEAGER